MITHFGLQTKLFEQLNEPIESVKSLRNERPISEGFEESLLGTSTVKQVNRILTEAGHKVTGVSYEKFYINASGATRTVEAMAWLELEPVSDSQD